MNIKKSDKAEKLLRYLASGLITKDEFEGLIKNVKAFKPSGDLIMVTLEEYKNFENEYEKGVVYALIWTVETIHGQKNGRKYIKNLNVVDFLGWMKYLQEAKARIKKQMDNIPKPAASQRVYDAMTNIFDFGIYGIIDRLAQRQGLTDKEAAQIPLLHAITKLKIDGEKAVINQRVHEAMAKEARAKTRRR